MDITDFFKIVTVRGNQEYDFLENSLSNFTMTYPVRYYTVVQEDLLRLDLISYKMYQTVDYWWLIGYVNGVENIWTDMAVGDLYTIPSVLDIYSFYKQYAINTNSNAGSTLYTLPGTT